MVKTTSASAPEYMALAKHLNQVGARVFGAFDCSNTYRQRDMFGSQAEEWLPYVECYPNGNGDPYDSVRGRFGEECDKADIWVFPTWVINGKLFKHPMGFDELAHLTEFRDNDPISRILETSMELPEVLPEPELPEPELLAEPSELPVQPCNRGTAG